MTIKIRPLLLTCMVMAGTLLLAFTVQKHRTGNIPQAAAQQAPPESTRDSIKCSPHPLLSDKVFEQAARGFALLQQRGVLSKPMLAIIDFSKPSSEERLFVIDMRNRTVLLHTLVAHGRNSGEKLATRFSNKHASYQSSLGFYITGTTYSGGNGYSMRLQGVEKGINDQAEARAIVMHGAPYVSKSIIQNTGRLGRSYGCPAVSMDEHKDIIRLLKEGSCLFIYAPDRGYLAQSVLLNSGTATL